MIYNCYENRKNSFQLEIIFALFKKNGNQMKKEIFFFTKIDFFLISEALKDLLYKTEAKKPLSAAESQCFIL